MSHLSKNLFSKTNHKPGESTSNRSGQDVGDSILAMEGQPKANNRVFSRTIAGTFLGLILILTLSIFCSVQGTHATASSLSVSVTGGANPSVNVAPTTGGRFIASGATTFSVSTTHAAGYTVTAGSTALTDGTDVISTLTLPSGTSGVAADDYNNSEYASENSLNNTWGYLPSNLCTTSGMTTTCAANTLYLPAPISSAQTLDEVKNAANNTYDISIGTRVTANTAQGAYAATFTLAVVGNATPYAITYNANTDSDTAANMPTNHTTSDAGTGGDTAVIDSAVPEREGYIFKGWCSVATNDNACSGTTYNPDGSGVDLDLDINQRSTINSYTLYAMWQKEVGPCSDLDNPWPNYICYSGNNADAGKMTPQSASPSSTIMLQAYNYKRAGYGFLGWSTVANPTIGTDTIYGPMEDITTPSTLGVKGLVLYAVWLPKSTTYTMQNFSSATCANQLTAITYNSSSDTFTATANSFISLEDTRDGNVYTVARMTDGFCWMLENLRLDESATNLKSNKYSQGGTSFSIATLPGSTNSFRMGASIIQWNKNNTDINNSGLTASYDARSAATKWYGYGNYYSWAAARGTTDALSLGSTSTSLCPANWRMPTGGSYTTNYSFGKLSTSMGGASSDMNDSSVPTGAEMSARLRRFPNNFTYSGVWYDNLATWRGSSGHYWSSRANDSSSAYSLSFSESGFRPSTISSPKYRGLPIRCVAGS